MATRKVITRIVKEIVEDLTDRRGLKQEWEQIDNEIRSEIEETWADIIASNLEIES